MQNKNPFSGLVDVVRTAKPFLTALAFSPWLILLYLGVSTYAKQLGLGDQGIIQGFIEWFGTAYSLFLALVLVNVWEQYDTLEREFDREVDAIATLYQTVNYALAVEKRKESVLFKFKGDIKKKIESYLNHVITNYQSEYLNVKQRHDGNKILEKIGESISVLGRDKVIIEPLVAELFRSLNEAMDVRGDRISHSKQRMPKTVWLVAIISSLVWLFPFLGLNIINPWVSLLLIGGVAFVIVIVLIIINDFDGPFDGTWKIELESWTELLEILNPTPHIVFAFKNKNRFIDLVSKTSFGKLFSLPICNLTSLSQDRIFMSDWKKTIETMSDYHTKSGKTIEYEQLYSTKLKSQFYYEDIKTLEFPAVILRINDNPEILVKTQEITRCASLIQFEKLLNRKIKRRLS